MQRKKNGKIVPNGVVLEKHELEIAVIFTNLGFDVELIPLARSYRQKTADAIICGVEWEFKTLREGSTRAIERILRRAAKQSSNIVVDVRHLGMPKDILIKKLQYGVKQVKEIKHLKMIYRPNDVLDII